MTVSRTVLVLAFLLGLSACDKIPAIGALDPAAAVEEAREPNPQAHDQRIVLRVLTFNAFVVPFRSDHLAARERMGPAIGALRPDLVALQEVWHREDAEALAHALADEGLAHQRWFASAATLAYGSPGLLIASRYPLSRTHYQPYTAGTLPLAAWHLDWFSGKGIVEVEVETPLGPIRFVNTHLHAAYATHDYFGVRLGQAAELLAYVGPGSGDQTAGERADSPLILAGDLNARPDELPARLLRSGAGLKAVGAAGIDSILIRGGRRLAAEVLDSARVLDETVTYDDGSQGRLSDHAGVMASIALSRRAEPVGTSFERGWPATANETLAFIERERRRIGWQSGLTALLAVALSGTTVAGVRRGRRSRGWRRRLWLTAALGSLTMGLWAGYFAAVFGPAERAWLQRARETVETSARRACTSATTTSTSALSRDRRRRRDQCRSQHEDPRARHEPGGAVRTHRGLPEERP